MNVLLEYLNLLWQCLLHLSLRNHYNQFPFYYNTLYICNAKLVWCPAANIDINNPQVARGYIAVNAASLQR